MKSEFIIRMYNYYCKTSLSRGRVPASYEEITSVTKEDIEKYNKIREKSKEKKEELDQSKLPKSKRKYIHPKTGKEIGYTRAYNLGIIK